MTTAVHDAFISYSQSADGQLASALERGLESLAKPLFRLRAIDAVSYTHLDVYKRQAFNTARRVFSVGLPLGDKVR